jgi:plasmid stability protein
VAKLRVRKVEPEVIRVLENRARSNGRSLEDEVCEILRIARDQEDEETAKLAKSVIDPWEA